MILAHHEAILAVEAAMLSGLSVTALARMYLPQRKSKLPSKRSSKVQAPPSGEE